MYWPAAILAALGLMGLYCALLKNRSRGRLRCPRCWYDMAGTANPSAHAEPVRCPECGHMASGHAALRKTRRYWFWALVAALMIVPLIVVFSKLHAAKVYYAVMPRWKLAESAARDGTTINRYRVRNPDDWGERVLITSNGKVLLDRDDHTVTLNGYKHERETFIDADGDGVMEAVIECYSGGAHCCYRVFIVQAKPTGAAIIADIDARNGMAVLAPVHPQTTWSFNIADQTFDYWKVSHVESPMPSVFYRVKDGALRIDLSRMDTPAPTPAEFDRLVATARGTTDRNNPDYDRASLWRAALDLLYGGHEAEAWTLIDRAYVDKGWSPRQQTKEEFLAEFREALSKDPWYQDVQAARAARAESRELPPSKIGASGRMLNEDAR